MKVKVPGPDPSLARSQEYMARTAADAEKRAADNDAFYKTTLMPRYLDQMDLQLGLAREESTRQREMSDYALARAKKFDGLQDAYLKQVDQFDSADNRERMAGMAIADVQRGLNDQRGQMARSMMASGLNPNSGKYLSMLANQQVSAGLGQAAAANMAREAARREGMALRGAASGMGQSYLGQAGGFGMSSLGAMGAGMGALQGMQGAQGANAQQWGSYTGMGVGAMGDFANRGYQQQMMQFQAAQANAQGVNQIIGAGLGAAAGAMMKPSDRRLKMNVVKVGQRADGLGVYQWDYVWGGPRATGVMADEVRGKYPGAVSSIGGYDMVDYSKLGAAA